VNSDNERCGTKTIGFYLHLFIHWEVKLHGVILHQSITVKDRTTCAQCNFSYMLFLFFSAANYLCVASLQCNGLLPMVGSPEPKNTLVYFGTSLF